MIVGQSEFYTEGSEIIELFVENNDEKIFQHYISELWRYLAMLEELKISEQWSVDFVSNQGYRLWFNGQNQNYPIHPKRTTYPESDKRSMRLRYFDRHKSDYVTFEDLLQEKYPIEYDSEEERFRMRSRSVHDSHRLQFIVENLETYKSLLTKKIEGLSGLSVNTIYGIFKDILALKSLAPNIGNVSVNDSIVLRCLKSTPFKIHFLTNQTGLFGIGAYMHAYRNNILIVSLPSNRKVKYDGITAYASLQHTGHDFNHTLRILDVENKEIIDRIYDKVITMDIDELTREMLVLFLWIMVHEICENLFTEEELSQKPDKDGKIRIPLEYVSGLDGEINRIKHISSSTENIEFYRKTYRNYEKTYNEEVNNFYNFLCYFHNYMLVNVV